MDDIPFISIIIPVYNGETIISECLQSLLNQDYPKDKYEIIVVDNNSTDGTARVVKTFPVQYLSENKIQSAYAARNTGVNQARGEGLVFFDADQIVEKDFLSKFTENWQDTSYAAFAAKISAVGEKKSIASKYWHEQEDLQFDNQKKQSLFIKLGAGNALVRKSVFDKLGGFDSHLVSWGDFDFAYRLNKAGYRVKNLADVVIGHKERTTVKAMLKREYRIGFGRSQFDLKHRDFTENLSEVFFKAFCRAMTGIAAFLWGTVKPIHGKTRKEHLGLISLDVAMRWAYFLGRLQFYLPINSEKTPAKW